MRRQKAVDIHRAVAQQVALGHHLDHIARPCRLNPAVGAHDGVGQRLHGARVGLNKRLGRIEASGGHGAAKDLLGLRHDARVGHDLQVARTQQKRDDRVQVADGVDLARAHGCHGAIGRTHAHNAHLVGLDARLGQHVIHHHIGGAARRRNADLLATQVRNGLVVGHGFGVDAQHHLRRQPLQHKGAHRLALELHVHRVLKRARHHICAAAHHRLQRLGATGKIHDRDVQPLVLEVAQLLCNRQRQVIEQVLAAHGNGELGFFNGLGKGQVRQGCAGEGRGDKGAASRHLVSFYKWFGSPDTGAQARTANKKW